MRVLIICYHFPPDGAIGAVRPYQFARLLPEHGIEPWVLTVEPQFAEFRDDSLTIEGIPAERVIRTPVLLTKRRRFIKFGSALLSKLKAVRRSLSPGELSSEAKHAEDVAPAATTAATGGWMAATSGRRWLLECLLYPDRFFGWFAPAATAGSTLLREHKFDVILSSSPPIVAHLIARRLALRHELPWIMDLRDPWYLDDGERMPILSRLYQKLFVICWRCAAAVVLNTERTRQFVCNQYPELEAKTVAIPNGVIEPANDAPNSMPATTESRQRFQLGYYGNIYHIRSAATFLRGLRLWLDRQAGEKEQPTVAVRFMGHELADTAVLVEQLKLGDVVQLCAPVSRNQLGLAMHDDYVLLLIANDWPLQIPGKSYEYLAAGRRILAITEQEGSTSDMLRDESGCIIASTPDDVATALQGYWNEYRLGLSSHIDHEAKLDSLSYRRRASDMAEVIKRAKTAGSAGVSNGVNNPLTLL
jgi:glycosyltransferase involved in cell wall biosynthesis